ncbi:hypothetical protein OA88_10380 [Flavobacterium sp. JRM]|nr:hypothetical protein OA88_10380 [Flavobacterium sp. JRM]
MKQIQIFIFLILLLISCKPYKVEFIEYENASFKHVVEKTLKKYNAEEEQYSLLLFTDFYYGEHMTVENNFKVLYNDSIRTIKNFGLAKIIRINNRSKTKIVDEKTDIMMLIKPSLSKKYKFIYIEKLDYLKDRWGKDSIVNKKPYKIIYSNKLIGFM